MKLLHNPLTFLTLMCCVTACASSSDLGSESSASAQTAICQTNEGALNADGSTSNSDFFQKNSISIMICPKHIAAASSVGTAVYDLLGDNAAAQKLRTRLTGCDSSTGTPSNQCRTDLTALLNAFSPVKSILDQCYQTTDYTDDAVTIPTFADIKTNLTSLTNGKPTVKGISLFDSLTTIQSWFTQACNPAPSHTSTAANGNELLEAIKAGYNGVFISKFDVNAKTVEFYDNQGVRSINGRTCALKRFAFTNEQCEGRHFTGIKRTNGELLGVAGYSVTPDSACTPKKDTNSRDIPNKYQRTYAIYIGDAQWGCYLGLGTVDHTAKEVVVHPGGLFGAGRQVERVECPEEQVQQYAIEAQAAAIAVRNPPPVEVMQVTNDCPNL